MKKLPAGAYYIDTIETFHIDAQLEHPSLGMRQSVVSIELKVVVDPRDLPVISEAIFDERIGLTIEMPSRGRKARS